MQDRPLTRRPQGGHAPRTTDPRRPAAAAGARACCRAPTTRPSPNHRDTPADLAGRGHQPHARRRALGAHGRARPAAVPAHDVVRHAADPPTTPCTPPSRRAQRQIKIVYAYAQRPARRLRSRGRTRCRPTSRASSSSWRCRRAAGARCASTWAPSAARSTSTSRSCTCRNRSAYVSAGRSPPRAAYGGRATVQAAVQTDQASERRAEYGMARLRPVPPGPDTLGSGAEVGLSIMRPRADPDLALTHRSEVRSCASLDHSSSRCTCCSRLRPRPSAHDETRPRPHRHAGRPQGRRHHPHARDRAPDEHVAAQPDALRTDDVVRLAPDGRRQRVRRLPADAAPDQGRLRLRERPAGSVRRSGATRCRPTSRTSSSTSPCRRAARRALRFDMGTECGPQYVDIQVVRAAARARRTTATTRRNFYRLADDVAAAVGPVVGPARRVRPGRQPHRRSGVGHRPGHRRRPRRPGATTATPAA